MSTQHQEALRGSVVNSSRSSLHCRSVTRALLSIRPQYAAAILRGEKRYEFRRTVFSRHVDVVLVYVPSPVRRVVAAVSYTHLRAHETRHDLVCRLLLEKKKNK